MLRYLCLLSIVCFLFSSCDNGPGEGGRASIQGRVFVHIVACDDTLDSSYAIDEEVYIIAGDDPSYFDRVRTGPDGTFWFPYLRRGKYEVYALSEPNGCDEPFGPLEAVSISVDIEDRREEFVTGDIVITKQP